MAGMKNLTMALNYLKNTYFTVDKFAAVMGYLFQLAAYPVCVLSWYGVGEFFFNPYVGVVCALLGFYWADGQAQGVHHKIPELARWLKGEKNPTDAKPDTLGRRVAQYLSMFLIGAYIAYCLLDLTFLNYAFIELSSYVVQSDWSFYIGTFLANFSAMIYLAVSGPYYYETLSNSVVYDRLAERVDFAVTWVKGKLTSAQNSYQSLSEEILGQEQTSLLGHTGHKLYVSITEILRASRTEPGASSAPSLGADGHNV